MKHQRAPKGRRSTPPAPSIQELHGIAITRRQAYLAGHLGALFDELNANLNEAYRINDLRRVEDLPLLPDGSRDRRIRSDDDATVTLPLWAFDVIYDLAMDQMFKGSRGKGPTARWWQKYTKDLIHWHRYALVQQAIKDKRAKPGDDAYELIAEELAGTAFAATSHGIKKSVEQVVQPALEKGEHARFYRSHAARVYDFLLNDPAPIITDVGMLLLKSST
jgi:hypothetical protein